MMEKKAAKAKPAAQPIVKGTSLHADDGVEIPKGPCGKCQSDNVYPECQGGLSEC